MGSRPLAIVVGAFLLGALAAPTLVIAQGDRPTRKQLVDELYNAESFGASFRFVGVIGAFAFFDPTCSFPPEEEPLSPDTRCIVLSPAPEATEFDEPEISSMTIPGNTFRNVLCPVFLNIVNYQMRNDTGEPQPDGRFDFRASITIESDVLKDPAAVDPTTGQPLNGKLLIPWGRRLVSRSMSVGQREREVLQYTRACNAGVNKQSLIEANGLPPSLVDRLFRNRMTIHLNIAGTAKLVAPGSNMSLNMRLMGN